jgi:hypothetical protein
MARYRFKSRCGALKLTGPVVVLAYKECGLKSCDARAAHSEILEIGDCNISEYHSDIYSEGCEQKEGGDN